MSSPLPIGTLTSVVTSLTPGVASVPGPSNMSGKEEVWIFSGTFGGATVAVQISDGTNWVTLTETLSTAPNAYKIDALAACTLRAAVISGATGSTAVLVARASA